MRNAVPKLPKVTSKTCHGNPSRNREFDRAFEEKSDHTFFVEILLSVFMDNLRHF